MLFKTAEHYILNTLLLLALIFNQGLGILSSANAMSGMQRFADQDTLAICTGTSVKWISAAVFYQSGELIAVDAPSETPDNLHTVSCIFSHLNDSPKDHQFGTFQTPTNDVVTPIVNNAKRLFVTTDYVNNFLARGPPAFL
jgi:hypothetical protein